MAVSINQLSNGMTILTDGVLYSVVKFQHVKPGRGGAFVRVKLKNVRSGAVVDKTFRSGERIEEAYIEQKKIQYLYRAGDTFHFMNLKNFEETVISKSDLGQHLNFLKDNQEVAVSFYGSELIDIDLPAFINFKVTHTQAGIRGNTVKAGSKRATIESGFEINVPLFINQGDIIKVDTRTGEYVERAS